MFLPAKITLTWFFELLRIRDLFEIEVYPNTFVFGKTFSTLNFGFDIFMSFSSFNIFSIIVTLFSFQGAMQFLFSKNHSEY